METEIVQTFPAVVVVVVEMQTVVVANLQTVVAEVQNQTVWARETQRSY